MTHGLGHPDKHRYLVPFFFPRQNFYQGDTFGQDVGRVPMARRGSIRAPAPRYDRTLEVML
jgi:hypothetical protein